MRRQVPYRKVHNLKDPGPHGPELLDLAFLVCIYLVKSSKFSALSRALDVCTTHMSGTGVAGASMPHLKKPFRIKWGHSPQQKACTDCQFGSSSF